MRAERPSTLGTASLTNAREALIQFDFYFIMSPGRHQGPFVPSLPLCQDEGRAEVAAENRRKEREGERGVSGTGLFLEKSELR